MTIRQFSRFFLSNRELPEGWAERPDPGLTQYNGTTTYRGKYIPVSAIHHGEWIKKEATVGLYPINGFSVDPWGVVRWPVDHRSVKFLAPVDGHGSCYAFGRTYPEHIKAEGGEIPPKPNMTLFFKGVFPTEDGCPVKIPPPEEGRTYEDLSRWLDWEVELVAGPLVFIPQGTTASQIEALSQEGKIGYTVGNDFSERVDQFTNPFNASSQWVRGKSYRGFAPLGPILVTGINPHLVKLQLTVNGKLKQEGCVGDMFWTVFELIASCAELNDLLPGTIIFTGSPGGHGFGEFQTAKKKNPSARPEPLQPGDVVIATMFSPELDKPITLTTPIIG